MDKKEETSPAENLPESSENLDGPVVPTGEQVDKIKDVLGNSRNRSGGGSVHYTEDGDAYTSTGGGGDPGGYLPDPNGLDN